MSRHAIGFALLAGWGAAVTVTLVLTYSMPGMPTLAVVASAVGTFWLIYGTLMAVKS